MFFSLLLLNIHFGFLLAVTKVGNNLGEMIGYKGQFFFILSVRQEPRAHCLFLLGSIILFILVLHRTRHIENTRFFVVVK